jgi:hypothetical protein
MLRLDGRGENQHLATQSSTACSIECWMIGSACRLHSGHFLSRIILRPWRWRRHFLPKCRLMFNGLHSVIYQKIEIFVTIAVRTSNPLNDLPHNGGNRCSTSVERDNASYRHLLKGWHSCNNTLRLQFRRCSESQLGHWPLWQVIQFFQSREANARMFPLLGLTTSF